MRVILRKVKQGFETNKERLPIINLREVVSFRARVRLVITTRLQVQHSSFRLRTSSNTPSILKMMYMGLLLILMRNALFILQLLS
jgi:hypothetical protein